MNKSSLFVVTTSGLPAVHSTFHLISDFKIKVELFKDVDGIWGLMGENYSKEQLWFEKLRNILKM